MLWESSFFWAWFWFSLGLGGGCYLGFFIAWRMKNKSEQAQVRVNVDEQLLRWYINSHGYVLMPRGPEWTRKPGEKLQ